MQHEPGGRFGPDGGSPVVARGDLDVDASGAPVGVDVFDLRIGVEHASPRVDGQAEFLGGAVPFSVRCPSAASHAGRLAPACDGALEFPVETHAPDGGPLLDQALVFLAAGPIDGGVVRGFGGPGTGEPDLLAGIHPPFGGQLSSLGHAFPGERQTLNGLPLGPVAVVSLTSPSRIQALTARRVV